MSSKPRKKQRFVHETTEKRLSDLLRGLGIVFVQSQMLDHVHKIDILVHEIPPLRGRYHPIGVQITQKRDAVAKIETFFERSPAGTSGPLLYVEVHGRVTPHMAMALKTALVCLWLESPRNRRRQHRLAITQSGAFWWLSPRVTPATEPRKT